MTKTTKKTKTLRFWGVSPKFDIDIETCVSEGNIIKLKTKNKGITIKFYDYGKVF